MAGGPSPQTTSCSSQGEWNFMKRYFRFGIGLEEWDRSSASRTFSLPFLRFHIPSVTGLSRRYWGYQGPHLAPEHHALRFGVLGLGGWWVAIPEEEPQKCLNLSPYLPLLMSDLIVFVLSSCPSSLPSVLSWVAKGCFGRSWFPKHLASSFYVLKWQFYYLECKLKHLFGYLFLRIF